MRLDSRRRDVARRVALLAVATFSIAACTVSAASDTPEPSGVSAPATPTPTPVPTPMAVVSISPAPESDEVPLDARIRVAVAKGELVRVEAKRPNGSLIPGQFEADGTWVSKGRELRREKTYVVRAVAVDSAGLRTEVESSFRTLDPPTTLTTSISPLNGTTVGVGMPLVVHLSEPVPDDRRAAVQRRLTVTTSPAVEGSWSWLSDSELHYRPETYWPAGTDVAVRVNLLAWKAAPKLWGDEQRTVKFHVGDALVMKVDVSGHEMTVAQNGKLLRTIPVTTGKDGFITRNGIKVITSKERSRVMDAATIDIDKNDPEYYRLKVEYAMRLTWSGEFLHAAPWSAESQGLANVSHGCTGMSLADAAWLYGLVKVGDPVEFTHSPRGLEPGNGWTDWNVSWDDWTAGSAA